MRLRHRPLTALLLVSSVLALPASATVRIYTEAPETVVENYAPKGVYGVGVKVPFKGKVKLSADRTGDLTMSESVDVAGRVSFVIATLDISQVVAKTSGTLTWFSGDAALKKFNKMVQDSYTFNSAHRFCTSYCSMAFRVNPSGTFSRRDVPQSFEVRQ